MERSLIVFIPGFNRARRDHEVVVKRVWPIALDSPLGPLRLGPFEGLLQAGIFEKVVQTRRNFASMILVKGGDALRDFAKESKLPVGIGFPHRGITDHLEAPAEEGDEFIEVFVFHGSHPRGSCAGVNPLPSQP